VSCGQGPEQRAQVRRSLQATSGELESREQIGLTLRVIALAKVRRGSFNRPERLMMVIAIRRMFTHIVLI
jgi:hypothetical protein